MCHRSLANAPNLRTRSFFSGLTETIRKQSVASEPNDNAFAFTVVEDGVSASDWNCTNGNSSVLYDAARRSSVVKLHQTSGSSSFLNPGWWSLSSSKRALSFWYSGTANTMTVTGGGLSQKIVYYASGGTNYYNAGVHTAHIYGADLTTASGAWERFDRNVKADFESVSGGEQWVYVYSLTFVTSSTDYYVDDIRLSNAQTVEHNVLAPGAIGHILRHREINPTTYVATDRWFHYDQVGSLMSESNSSGALAQGNDQDAFGNTQNDWYHGLWGGDQPGWHHNSKELDGDIGLVYMYQRWYLPETGTFASRAPYPPMIEHPFSFAVQEPSARVDSAGTWAGWVVVHGSGYLGVLLGSFQAGLGFDGCGNFAFYGSWGAGLGVGAGGTVGIEAGGDSRPFLGALRGWGWSANIDGGAGVGLGGSLVGPASGLFTGMRPPPGARSHSAVGLVAAVG